MTNEKPTRFTRKGRLLLSILGCIPLPCLLAVAGPLDTFSRNRVELGFSAGDFLPLCLLIGGLSALGLFLLLFLLPSGGFRIAFPIILSLSLSALILSFVNRTAGLPGDANSEPTVFQNVAGIAIPVLLLAAALVGFLLVRRADLLTTVSAFVLIPLLVMTAVSVVTVLTSDPDLFSPAPYQISTEDEEAEKTVTNVGITDLGGKSTVLYICIDRLDETFCRTAEELDPTVFSSFDGFTHYTDHVSLYSNTYPAVCYMLTGREADFSLSREENYRLGYESPRLLGALRDAGYSIGLYGEAYYCFGNLDNIAPYADNLLPDGKQVLVGKSDLSFEMLGVSLFRSTPSVFSSLFSWLSTDVLTGHLVTPSAYGGGGNLAVAGTLLEKGFDVKSGNRFSYVHITGMHGVLRAEDDPNKTLALLKQCLSVVDLYLDALRDAGLYRDATIVVTGDHPSPISDDDPVNEPRVTALFVKRRGDEKTPLRTSAAQVYQGQIASEILDSVGIELNENDPLPLSKTPKGNVVRYHNFVVTPLKRFRVDTYRIEGPADDFANWVKESSVSYQKTLYN